MIRLFNSLTQRKEELVPRDEGKVGIYACGPTVYNLVHVGNARPYVVFAVLRAWLTSRGYRVTLVENITDVNDKINAKADAEGRSPLTVAAEFTQAYLDDTDRLGVPRPDVEPLASETIPEIIDLVCQLVAAGHAYEAQGSVYFRVRSFPDYGKLSGQRIDELEQETRVEAEPGKEDPLDFAVWKAAKPGERDHLWDSPWGKGRPGWHIECSAMGLRYLGARLRHPRRRQRPDLPAPRKRDRPGRGCTGKPFARIWMHNGMLRADGEKMAKSVGNISLLREVLDRYPAPVVLTYFLTTHYRSPLEFSIDKLDEAGAAYERLVEAVRTASFRADNPGRGATHDPAELRRAVDHTRTAFAEHMDDDLNTAAALGELFGLGRELFRYVGATDAAGHGADTATLEDVEDLLVESLDNLCITLPDDGLSVAPAAPPDERRGEARAATPDGEVCATDEVPLPPAARLAAEGRWDDLAALVDERLSCGDATYACLLRDHLRADKEWVAADGLRDRLVAAGFEVRDTAAGTQVVRKA